MKLPVCFLSTFLTAWQAANRWLEWYKSLFTGVAPGDSANPAPAAGVSTGPAQDLLLALPKKKDGTVSTF
jgi:hypothetical protein